MSAPEPPPPTAEDFARLAARVQALEQRLGLPPRRPLATAPAPTVAAPEPAPSPPPPPHSPSAPAPSLEDRIGSQWFARVGVIAILCGVAWLLKWAMDNGWLAPPLRLVLGLLAGLAFLACGERMWRKQIPLTAYALFGVGNGILYLTLWAADSLYHVLGAAFTLALMAALTAFNGYRSWTNNSRPFAAYALLLGFLIPVLLANGENHEIELFVFLVVLDAAVAVVAVLKPWRFLLPSALAGTVLLGLGWSMSFLNRSDWQPMVLFTLLAAVLFGAACGTIGARRPNEDDGGLHALTLPILTAVFAWAALRWDLMTATAPRAVRFAPNPWIGAACLAVALVSFGHFAAARAPAGNCVRFRATQLALALSFTLLATLAHCRSSTLVLALAAEGAVLVGVAARWPRWRSSRVVAQLALLGALLEAMFYPYAGAQPLWNPVLGLGCATVAALGLAAWLAAQSRPGNPQGEPSPRLLRFSVMTPIFASAATLLIWVIGLRVIHIAWWGAPGYVPPLRAAALHFGSQFSYSIWCMVLGALLLALGFWRLTPGLRWQGLVLLVVAAAKVFLYDMSALSQGWRVLSFFGLGALLLLISFAYQRDWLALRRAG
ncbi:MAG: DUF2339 domain-containing protein [Terriglobales bacterium]